MKDNANKKPVIIHEPKGIQAWQEFPTIEAARQKLEAWAGDEFDVKTVFITEKGRKRPVGIYWMGHYYPVEQPVFKRYAVIAYADSENKAILFVHRENTLKLARQWVLDTRELSRYYAEIVDGDVHPYESQIVVERYQNQRRIDP